MRRVITERVMREQRSGSRGGGDFLTLHPGGTQVNSEELYNFFKHDDIVIEGRGERYLLTALKKQEPLTGNIETLNRIIRNGGLINYIQGLEDRANA
jgi:hypothetical protein